MEHTAPWILLLLGLTAALWAMLEAGRRQRARRQRLDPKYEEKSLGAVEAAIFSLLGLLLAFAFTGAASRFDDRRALVVAEANALGTAYLRFELVPSPARETLRARFRAYVDARLAGYRALPHDDVARTHFERAMQMQEAIWTGATEACREAEDSRAAIVLLPALNNAFDLAEARMATFYLHPPRIVFLLLVTLSLLCAVLAGWSMGESKHRSRLHVGGFVLSLALTLYLTLDLELPRHGLVTIRSFDAVLEDVRARMK